MTETKQLTSIFEDISLEDFQVKINQQASVALHWVREGGSPKRNAISGAAEFLDGVEKAQFAEISDFYAKLRARYDEVATLVNAGRTDQLPVLYMLLGTIQLVEYMHAIELGKYGQPVTADAIPREAIPVAPPVEDSVPEAMEAADEELGEEDEDEVDVTPDPVEDDSEDEEEEDEPVVPKKRPKKPKKAE